MQKAFRAVPLTNLASVKAPVSVLAETDFAALLRAKELLGSEVPFDLSEGDRLVVTYRPTRTPFPVRIKPRSDG